VVDCVGVDSTICMGYLERHPRNSTNDPYLFKNSFKGYISEFSFIKDQPYFRKFGNIKEYNSFD